MAINSKQTGINPIELYFEWFLNELRDEGYIINYYREPHGLEVFAPAPYKRYSFGKASVKVEDFNILPKDNYTPDYMIIWSPKAKDIFYSLIDGTPILNHTPFYAYTNMDGSTVSLCDVKAPSGATHFAGLTAYTFPVKQKVLWNVHGIMVNKAIPIPMVSKGEVKSGNAVALFTSCFCPRRYTFTDGGTQPRKIHYKYNNLKQYVAMKEKELSAFRAILQKHNTPTLL